MQTIKRTALVLFILFGCVGCDQATKQLAKHSLAGSPTISLLHDSLRLQYAENPGAFLSLGAQIPETWRYALFTLLVGVCLAALLLYLVRADSASRATTLSLTLVVGGGLGNLLDRIFHHGRVIDFLNLGIGPVRTGIFNVADIAITCGVIWLGWHFISGKKFSSERP